MVSNELLQNKRGNIIFVFVFIYSAFVFIRPHEYFSPLMGLPILPVLLIGGALLWILIGRKEFYVSQHKLILFLLIILSLSPILKGWPGGVVVAFAKFYPIVIFYFLLVAALCSGEKIVKFYWLYVTASFIMGLHGIDQSTNGVGWSGARPVMDGRITYVGIFNDPNDLGNFFVSSLPIITFLLFYHRSKIIKLILLAYGSIVLYGIFLTNSRGAILGVAGMIWFYLAQKYGFVKAIFTSLLFLPVMLLAPSRVSEIDPNEASAAGRVEAWYEGIQMLINSRFLGVGYGGFVDHHYLTAHNSFVLVFAELGLVGYFVWFAFLFLTYFMAYKKLQRAMSKVPEERNFSERLAFPVFYSLIGFAVTAFFLSRSYNILLYILSAVSISNYINDKGNDALDVTLSNYFHMILLLMLGSLAFFYVLVKVLLSL